MALSANDAPAVASNALAIGAPEGLSWSVTMGAISGVRQLRVARVAQFDKALDPGDSGGPLIDQTSGKVIGVMSFTDANYGFAVLAEEARKAFGGQIPQ